jgi:predicted HTH transcriptional regulator
MLRPDEVLAALPDRVSEAKDLHYKPPMGWDESGEAAACCRLVKQVLAMADTARGHIIIGVLESATERKWVGADRKQAASLEATSLSSFVRRYADPPVTLSVAKPQYNGKRHVLIAVPEFPP